MRIVYFTHSLRSCWNHGNAHFLRGVVAELLDRGHDVRTYEPRDGWSRQNLVADAGEAALDSIRARFPWMSRVARDYDLDTLDLDGYHYLHATRADLLRRLGREREARAAYGRALELVHSEAERRFLELRLAELT